VQETPRRIRRLAEDRSGGRRRERVLAEGIPQLCRSRLQARREVMGQEAPEPQGRLDVVGRRNDPSLLVHRALELVEERVRLD
jgi:hypothetical protein